MAKLNSNLAVEYEFYFPQAIYSTKAVQGFIRSLESLSTGSVVFSNALGKWKQNKEAVYIYRKVVPNIRERRKTLRNRLVKKLAELNSNLPATKKQDVVVFSEREILWVKAKMSRKESS